MTPDLVAPMLGNAALNEGAAFAMGAIDEKTVATLELRLQHVRVSSSWSWRAKTHTVWTVRVMVSREHPLNREAPRIERTATTTFASYAEALASFRETAEKYHMAVTGGS